MDSVLLVLTLKAKLLCVSTSEKIKNKKTMFARSKDFGHTVCN